jgi:type IV pilus assembly protein PilY1
MMKSQHWVKKILWLGLLLPGILQAEFLDLATMPLQTSGSSDVKPNLMFVLDNSGSMAWDYAPDWANSSSDWLFANADYNTQYYNPEVQYLPPLTSAGTSMSNQTNFSAVPNEVNDQGGGKNGTTDIRSIAYYYAFIPGEFCNTPSLKSCVISKVPTGDYTFPASIRWCNSGTAAVRRDLSQNASWSCQKIRNASTTVNDTGNTYTNLRRPVSTYTLTLNKTSSNASVQSIKINNMELLSGTVSTNFFDNSSSLASDVLSAMCRSSSLSGNCKLASNKVTRSANILTIETFAGEPINAAAPIQVIMTGGNYTAQLNTNTTSDIPGSMVYVSINNNVANYTAPGLSTKGLDRTDCAGTKELPSTCTYNEEMVNFANWWAYYRTRMQSMKTAASQAFKALDSRYRVGFVTINNPKSNYLAIAPFNTSQKQSWYQKLFAASPNGGTPLRTALSSVGQHFAGKQIFGNDDPIQYACQPNFTLLTTDGYWNDSSTPTRINGAAIGDQDGTSPRPQFDKSRKSNTLADTSKYFYDTDIRDGALSNCTGALGSSVCGTTNDYPKQNMVTMTLGLGIDGTLVYTEDYKTRTSGDYRDIAYTETKNWPDPTVNEDGTRIDDLWHAAVNAGGVYYSASNPKLLRESLAKGLSEIKSIQGASAAAAASSLAPTDGDNFQYVASYQTVKWTGNLEARTVNPTSLQTSQSAVWCVETVGETCASPSTSATIGSKLYCKTTNSDEAACGNAGGALGSALGTTEPASCYVAIAPRCNGRLQNQVGPNRKIYFNANNALTLFTIDNLSAENRSTLEKGYDNLSQMIGLPATDARMKATDKAAKLVDYLRGNKTYEDSGLNTSGDNRLFRERQATLGDISQSRPVYFKASNVDYLDAGYKAYKASRKAQLGGAAVYVGANDGMLHAFNADNGDELWAFIPTPVFANLANLADKEYGANYHTNYVNGSPVVADVCISGCSGDGAVWRSILVSGLNGGGRGYFAIDVTDSSNPVLLWEFGTQASPNLGYTFGNPLVTKMQDGRWVVLFTSGYNNGGNARKKSDGTFVSNVPAGDGRGYLYVLDAYTGRQIRTPLTTGEGNAGEPSGLSKISGYADQMFENNMVLNVYGGDLNGNMWRFNINTGEVTKIATFSIGSTAQKITTQAELGKVDSNKVLMVGTGKFLEPADLTNTPVNSVYVFKDNGQTSPTLRDQLTPLSLSSDRVVTASKAVSFESGYGWRLDFPAGERVNLDPLLINGALLMPTMVPTSEACNGAGYGWFNFFDYKKGGALLTSGIVSERMTTPAVGYNIVYDGNGVPHVVVTGSNDPTPQQLSLDDQIFGLSASTKSDVIFKQKANGSYGTKQSWHELIQ